MTTRTLTIIEQYTAQRQRSAELHERARRVLPGGVVHDRRRMQPFPPYILDSDGAHKRDVDGYELLDFVMGHGALLLGHNRPEVTGAVAEQAARGTHLGGANELEVRWAEAVVGLVPSAERVRFTASGTEATHLAIRLARAWTGRTKLLKLDGHFHGWHDAVTPAQTPPYDRAAEGVPGSVASQTLSVPPTVADVERALETEPNVAALILEPSGATYAAVPLAEGFLRAVRELTAAHDVLLIFDEVVTGFRWSPGGAQELYGVAPDLTTLAKVLAGGLSGGAVAGPAAILDQIETPRPGARADAERVVHQGTFNANPLSASAGRECLSIVASGEPGRYADRLAARLRIGLNERFEALRAPGCAYGESSVCQVILGDEIPNRTAADLRRPELSPEVLKVKGSKKRLKWLFGLAMLNEGVDLFSSSAFLSTAHTDADVDFTVEAFERAVARLRAEGEL